MGDLARVLDPDFVSDVELLSVDEVRSRRQVCTEIETSLSYVRRLAQGRLDILVADLQRRAMGDTALDLNELVVSLTEVLTKKSAPGGGRFIGVVAPADDDELVAQLDEVLSDRTLGDISSLQDSDAIALGEGLRDFERRVSADRRLLHEHMAVFEADLVRRYRDGEASVDTLIAGTLASETG